MEKQIQFIKALLKADNNYLKNMENNRNNMPNYPDAGGGPLFYNNNDENFHNSNSYVSGILGAVGANSVNPSKPDVWGVSKYKIPYIKEWGVNAVMYDKLVPKENFE